MGWWALRRIISYACFSDFTPGFAFQRNESLCFRKAVSHHLGSQWVCSRALPVQDLLLRLYMPQLSWNQEQESCLSSAQAHLSYWEAMVLISWGISCCWSRDNFCYLNYCWCCPPRGVCFPQDTAGHVAGLHFVENEFTREWITEFSQQKKERALRPDVGVHCRALEKSAMPLSCWLWQPLDLRDLLSQGLHFLELCTHAVCSPTPLLLPTLSPHSCAGHVALLVPTRTVNLCLTKTSGPPNLMVSTEDGNISEPKIKFVYPIKTTTQTFLHTKYKLTLHYF